MSHLITHTEPNHLSGNSGVNSSCVLQWQVLISSDQPGRTHYVGEKGEKNLHNYKTSPAFSPASKQFILWGVESICRTCTCLPIFSSHVLGYSLYFVLSAAALSARIKNSLLKMCKSAKAWFPWSVPVMGIASAHFLSSLSLCHTMPRKLSSGPLILGNPESFLFL